jgi:PAS domain S-box-containing protein
VDAEPELNDNGNIVNVVCTFIDITERKLAEEEIKKSKKTYRGVLNSISELIYIQDENGCFLDVNDAVVSKYGYPKEYFIGKTPEFLSAPGKNNFDRIIEAIANAWKGSKENFEFWGISKDGRIFPKEVNLSLGTYFGKQAIIAVGRDISEGKAFEDTLTNTNSILNATIESTNNGILVVNSEGAIIKRNEKFSELWQIPEDILSTDDDTKLLAFILYQLTQPEEFLAKVNDLYAKPFSESIDEIYFKDGRIFKRISKPMYIDAEPKGRVWSFEDITENKYAVDELNKSEKKYRQLIESTNEGIVVAQGSYLKFVNSVVIKLMGRTEDELMKVPFLEYVHKEDRMLVRKNYLKRIAEDNTISKFQYRINAKNSSVRWIEMSGIVINWNGQPAALNFMTDITENFEYLKAIEEQKQKLSEIAWIQSHMVRAPLARMMGLINLLNYENKLDENTRQLLKHILDSAHEFDTIIKSIVQNTQQKCH